MAQRKVRDIQELMRALDEFRTTDEDWMFRGQACSEWKLLPKVGRPEFAGVDDLELLGHWKRFAAPYVGPNTLSEWDWITLAQHHGLATRLLDWTLNPLAAAYFAVISHYDTDGVISCFAVEDESYYLRDEPQHIQDVTDVRILLPRHVSQRIARQSGRFTVHPVPSEPLKRRMTSRIVVSKRAKQQIQRDLNYLGINSATLFPGLDGLARFLNWFRQQYQR